MQQVHLHGLHLLHGQDLYHIWKSVDQEGLQGGAVHLCQEVLQFSFTGISEFTKGCCFMLKHTSQLFIRKDFHGVEIMAESDFVIFKWNS